MKKQLFLFLCTLLSMLAGVQKVQAYTVENLVEDGWTLVNSESVTGVADNFYVLVDAIISVLATRRLTVLLKIRLSYGASKAATIRLSSKALLLEPISSRHPVGTHRWVIPETAVASLRVLSR